AGKDDEAPVSSPPSGMTAEPPPAVEPKPLPEIEPEAKAPAETAATAEIRKQTAGIQARIAEMERAEQLTRQAQQPSPPPQPQQPPTVDQVIAHSGLPPKFQNWLRQHPDYINDPAKNEQLRRLHAVAEYQTGETGFTDAIYDKLEELFGTRPQSNGNAPAREAP